MIPDQLLPPDAEAAAALVTTGASPGRVVVDGQNLLNFSSCDYLGLSRHPDVLSAAHKGLQDWGLGTGSGRILTGTTVLHRDLETAIASWVGCEDAVLHGSCWSANAAVVQTLADLAAQAGTTLAVFSARLNHASIIDGIRAQRAVLSRTALFDHQTPGGLEDLREQLASEPAEVVKAVVTDGVFSMEGDQAPLRALVRLAEEFDAILVVDDSHGTGVVGATGRGTAQEQDLLGRVGIITGTLGKALGGSIGGFVATTGRLTYAVRSRSRSYTFSNNPPPHIASAVSAALGVLQRDPKPLSDLRERERQLRAGVVELGYNTTAVGHPIVPVLIGDEHRTAGLADELRRAGVYAKALTFPIVPRGEARLRLQVTAAHSPHDIHRLLTALDRGRPRTRTRTRIPLASAVVPPGSPSPAPGVDAGWR